MAPILAASRRCVAKQVRKGLRPSIFSVRRHRDWANPGRDEIAAPRTTLAVGFAYIASRLDEVIDHPALARGIASAHALIQAPPMPDRNNLVYSCRATGRRL